MFVNDAGEIILTTEDMLINLESDIPELIQVGYTQSDCNEEGWVDLDDAIRIFMEDSYSFHGLKMSRSWEDRTKVPARYNATSLHLYGTLLRVKARSAWEKEFPGNRSTEKSWR